MVAGGVGCSVLVIEFLVQVLRFQVVKCMRDLIWVILLCSVEDSGRSIRRDCGFVIRSRGRWGKCG